MEAPPREADLDPLALAREQASEAAALPCQVCKAPEAFQADPLPLTGALCKALAPMVLAATTVVTTVDFPVTVTATATMHLAWAAATD